MNHLPRCPQATIKNPQSKHIVEPSERHSTDNDYTPQGIWNICILARPNIDAALRTGTIIAPPILNVEKQSDKCYKMVLRVS